MSTTETYTLMKRQLKAIESEIESLQTTRKRLEIEIRELEPEVMREKTAEFTLENPSEEKATLMAEHLKELIGNRTGVVEMSAMEAFGVEHHVRHIPDVVLEKLSALIGHTASVVPDEFEDVYVYGAGLPRLENSCFFPNPTKFNFECYTEEEEDFDYSVVGNLAEQMSNEKFWGQEFEFSSECYPSFYMLLETKDYHPWKSQIPKAALFISKKRIRNDTEDNRETKRSKPL